MKDQKKPESEWDKKKIFLFVIAVVVILVLGFEIKNIILGKNSSSPQVSQKSVQGASSEVSPVSGSDLQKSIQDQVNNLKNEAQNINVVDIATSSPQVQKVISDLKALQEFPSNQLKETCQKICNGL